MRRLRRLWVLGVGLAIGCDSDGKVLAPPPERLFGEEEPRPTLPRTILNVPLLLDLGAAVKLMEAALPTKLGNIEERLDVPGNDRGQFAFELRREPFRVTVRADTFLVSSIIHYQGKGWYDPPIGPEVGGSCGTKGEEPRARLVLAVRPEIDQNWRLIAKPTLRYLEPVTQTERDQCEVSFLKLDVTSKVLAAARGAVRAELPRIAADLAALDVKAEFAKVWREIQKPIRLADSVWLTLQPAAIRMGRVSGTGSMVGTTVGIDAEPRIEAGERPPTTERPLPPLTPAADETGLNVLIEARIAYDVIDRELSTALVGKEISAPGGVVRIEEIGAFGIGKGRLALGVRFGGTSEGQIYFIGTPKFDPATGTISVPDLDYEASTASLLVKGLAWLKAGDIRDYLRKMATFPSADALVRITDLAAKGMNTELAPGVSMTASFNRTDVIRILPRADQLVIQARASGQAALHITDAFFQQLGPAGGDSAKVGSAKADSAN